MPVFSRYGQTENSYNQLPMTVEVNIKFLETEGHRHF